MSVAVGVHGIGNFQPRVTPEAAAAALGERWSAAVRRGLGPGADAAVNVAYYADRLATDVAQADSSTLDALDGPAQELLLAWAGALGAPDEVAQGRVMRPVRALADWIAHGSNADDGVVHRFIARFCREVTVYLEQPERREAARAVVAREIAERTPQVVIAHSLGSVVAYEALWAFPDPAIELLVTLGSPLGLPGAIFEQLNPAPVARRGLRPPGVHRWVNIADPGDLVALPRTGLASCFDGVNADLQAPIGVFGFHKVAGYLTCPTTAAALAAAF